MSAATKGAKKALIWLGIILGVLYGVLGAGVATGNATWTPALALDLAGGRQIILEAVTTDGSAITQDDLDQAVEIIRRRVDASGVAESEITTAGSSNIVVSLPGNPDDETLDLVRRSAQLQFRPVLFIGDPSPVTPSPEPSATPQPSATPLPSASVGAAGDASAVSPSASPEPSAAPSTDTPTVAPVNPSDLAWITPEVEEAFYALDCFDPNNRAGADTGDPQAAHVACSEDGLAKLIMGPVELTGTDVATASSGPELSQTTGAMTGRYEVRLQLTSAGATKFAETTTRLSERDAVGNNVLAPPRNQFAILLDGVVISYPSVNEPIPNGEAAISGTFTQQEAAQLANQLKFGALPLTLEVQSEQQIAATQGAEQLRYGLIAGAIGLALVVIYSLFQYRALAVVTVGSLVIAGALTLVVFSLLSWGMGLRLSLAGVAGMIVAIGITVDSFIVYFERIKDEIRDGRSLQGAVDHAWRRARRTIIVSDAVSFLAAVVLYVLAVGGVRGFAFTLGLTTVMDLLVVLLFTHPLMVLLARTSFYGDGHAWSGLDPRRLGRKDLHKERTGTGMAFAAAMVASFDDDREQGLTLAERKARARVSATKQEEL